MRKPPPNIYRQMEDKLASFFPTKIQTLHHLKSIHAQIILNSLSNSPFLSTKLVTLCASLHQPHYADLIFLQTPNPTLFLYNALIRAHTLFGNHLCTLSLFLQMLKDPKDPIFPDNFTYPFVLKSCSGLLLPQLGRGVHGLVWKTGWGSVSVVENSVLEMYAKCGGLGDALEVFDEMRVRDVVSWNTVLAAFVRMGKMRKGRAFFECMPEKSVVSWTVLVSGYVASSCYSDAVEVFYEMQVTGVKVDDIAVVSVLPACAHLGALELGSWIHRYCDRNGLLGKTHVGNALIEMYAKCGCVDRAVSVFRGMVVKDVISWSTMIGGFAHHGLAREAIGVFSEMERSKGVEPNSVTFLAILSACAHAGFLAEGLKFFELMVQKYGLVPSVEHYGCIVDLLGRSGLLARALDLINNMTMQPDAVIWGSLLSACKTYGDVETAVLATKKLVELEPHDTGNYVILSNIYAAAGRWDDVAHMRKLMKTRNMKKMPGCSSIEIDNVVVEFVAGDDSNPQLAEMSEILDLLALQLSDTDTDLLLVGE